MTPAQRTTMSFLDLALIMTGVMAMIASVGDRHPGAAVALAEGFGSDAAAAQQIALPLASIFEPQEARLTEAGIRQIAAVAAKSKHAEFGIAVPVVSESGVSRLDRWELAAARTAAIMRVLGEQGIADDAMVPDLARPGGSGAKPLVLLSVRETPAPQ